MRRSAFLARTTTLLRFDNTTASRASKLDDGQSGSRATRPSQPASDQSGGGSWLFDFFAVRSLPGSEERLHPFAFPADRHAWKPLEPFVVRHFGFVGEPVCQQTELISRDAALLEAIEQMVEQSRRKTLAADFRPAVSGRRNRAQSPPGA